MSELPNKWKVASFNIIYMKNKNLVSNIAFMRRDKKIKNCFGLVNVILYHFDYVGIQW